MCDRAKFVRVCAAQFSQSFFVVVGGEGSRVCLHNFSLNLPTKLELFNDTKLYGQKTSPNLSAELPSQITCNQKVQNRSGRLRPGSLMLT